MSDDTFDHRLFDADLESCRRSHVSLVQWLHSLDPVDAAGPSLLPDWSIGHVLTHIARVADGHRNVLDGRPMYPSFEARNADIAAGAGRSWGELVDDVTESTRALDEQWANTTDWSGTVAMLAGPRPKHMLPMARQREVEVHRADLGLGYGFDDMPAEYVRRDLGLMEMMWQARKPMGLTALPEAALQLPPATRLAWMMGRVEVEGLAPAGLF